MPYKKLADNLGVQTIAFLEELGKISLLARETIMGIVRRKVRLKLTMDQIVKIGYESLPLAIVTSTFVGMVFAIQIAAGFVKFGAGKYVGSLMAIAIARELGPAIAGIVIAGRVAAAITAEIGTMQVTEQIDALKALGSNPVRYIVIPRFIACASMLPLLTVFADALGFTGGYMVSVFVGKINPVDYMETSRSMIELWDIWGGLLKTVFFGMIIAIVACYKGLNTKGGAKGVGESTTSSVVTSLISLFIVNYFLSVLFFK